MPEPSFHSQHHAQARSELDLSFVDGGQLRVLDPRQDPAYTAQIAAFYKDIVWQGGYDERNIRRTIYEDLTVFATFGNVVIGAASFCPNRPNEVNPDSSYTSLDYLAVAEKFRRKRLALAMVETGVIEALALGDDFMTVTSLYPEADNFYLRVGFVPVEQSAFRRDFKKQTPAVATE